MTRSSKLRNKPAQPTSSVRVGRNPPGASTSPTGFSPAHVMTLSAGHGQTTWNTCAAWTQHPMEILISPELSAGEILRLLLQAANSVLLGGDVSVDALREQIKSATERGQRPSLMGRIS